MYNIYDNYVMIIHSLYYDHIFLTYEERQSGGASLELEVKEIASRRRKQKNKTKQNNK